MTRITELADRYVAAYSDGDDSELRRIALDVAPNEWAQLMHVVGTQVPELVEPLDPCKLSAAAQRHGIDPALAAAVATGLTATLATWLKAEGVSAELAERFCEAAPSLSAHEAEHVGRVRFHLNQLARGLRDASRFSQEALRALAEATGQSLAYIRELAAASASMGMAGQMARADEQQVGEGAQARAEHPVVDRLFGLDG